MKHRKEKGKRIECRIEGSKLVAEKYRECVLMPKFKAIGAISETIVLTSTPTSHRATSSAQFGMGFLIYPGTELFKLSYLCQSCSLAFLSCALRASLFLFLLL